MKPCLIKCSPTPISNALTVRWIIVKRGVITRLSGIRINSYGYFSAPPALSIKPIRVLVINAHNLGIVLAIANNGMYLSMG